MDAALTGDGLRFPAVRLVQDGEVLDRSTFTRTTRTGRIASDDLIDPGRVLDLVAGGATVVLQALQRWWAPVTRFCRELELELGHPMQANAYLTPAGAAGLAPHHDTHDLFIVQLHGAKRWAVRAPAVAVPLAGQRSDHELAPQQPVLFETELRPGDCLYLPRGYVHSASAQEATSLHLTLGVLATTVHDLLRRLIDLAAKEDPALRRALPVGYATEVGVATSAVKGAIAELTERLARLDPAPVAEDLVRRFWVNRRPQLEGQLLELDRLAALQDETPIAPRSLSTHRGELVGERLRVVLGDRVVDFPAAVAPAVGLLLDGSVARPADLAAHLDEASRLVLVRRLVREGLLRTDPS